MRSPGRPGVARREDRQRFWAAIADGFPSEAAGVVSGVSPAVASCGFREGGGTPSVSRAPLSGRYVSFAERDEIAILKAGGCGGAMPRLEAAGATPQDGQARVQPGQYVQDRLAGVIANPRWRRCRVRACAGSAAVTDAGRTAAGRPPGVRIRSPNRLPVDFPDDDLARGDL
jgi:hypothetical protein